MKKKEEKPEHNSTWPWSNLTKRCQKQLKITKSIQGDQIIKDDEILQNKLNLTKLQQQKKSKT